MSKNNFKLSIPIVFTVFNRPDKTELIFESIRQAKPRQLLVVADGPRHNHPSDIEKCIQVKAVIEQVDWECEVLTNYSERNLGCRIRITTGLDWVFKNVTEAIIIEDDCLPHPTFYRFCEELLHVYKDDERIMAISGNNFQFRRNPIKSSYYFSRYPHVWGWATWRRAWNLNTPNMEDWPQFRDEGWLEDIFSEQRDINYWKEIFNLMDASEIDTWDYIWTYACWINSGLTIIPSVNLVSNIGFGDDSTHTTSINKFSNMPVYPMTFPLIHPKFVLRNVKADNFTQKNNYDRENRLFRLKKKVMEFIFFRKFLWLIKIDVEF